MEQVCERLEADGLEKFSLPFDTLHNSTASKRQAALGEVVRPIFVGSPGTELEFAL